MIEAYKRYRKYKRRAIKAAVGAVATTGLGAALWAAGGSSTTESRDVERIELGKIKRVGELVLDERPISATLKIEKKRKVAGLGIPKVISGETKNFTATGVEETRMKFSDIELRPVGKDGKTLRVDLPNIKADRVSVTKIVDKTHKQGVADAVFTGRDLNGKIGAGPTLTYAREIFGQVQRSDGEIRSDSVDYAAELMTDLGKAVGAKRVDVYYAGKRIDPALTPTDPEAGKVLPVKNKKGEGTVRKHAIKRNNDPLPPETQKIIDEPVEVRKADNGIIARMKRGGERIRKIGNFLGL